MPDRASAETALNPLAVTPVEDPKDRLFWSASVREELRSSGEKSRSRGFRGRLRTDVGLWGTPEKQGPVRVQRREDQAPIGEIT